MYNIPYIHGVSSQVLINICERILVRGKVFLRDPMVYQAEFMGYDFFYSEIDREAPLARTIVKRGVEQVYFVDNINGPSTRLLMGEDFSWEVCLRTQRVFGLADNIVRWGKEATLEIGGFTFAGDEEKFQEQMAIVLLADNANWDQFDL